MLDALQAFLRRFAAKPAPRHFGEDDHRLALAALLIGCMSVDGAVSDSEQRKLEAMLGRTFGLSGEDLETLVADARTAEQEAVDLYRFTSVIKRQMGEEERVRVVESLWEIVFADGRVHEFEENMVWRVAELLGVSRQDRIAAKRVSRENRSGEAGDDG